MLDHPTIDERCLSAGMTIKTAEKNLQEVLGPGFNLYSVHADVRVEVTPGIGGWMSYRTYSCGSTKISIRRTDSGWILANIVCG